MTRKAADLPESMLHVPPEVQLSTAEGIASAGLRFFASAPGAWARPKFPNGLTEKKRKRTHT